MSTLVETSILFDSFTAESLRLSKFVTRLAEFTSPLSEDGASLSKSELCELHTISSEVLECAQQLHARTELLLKTSENT